MPNKKLPRHEVKVGQTWKDCDKRMNGRTIRVERIENGFAFCKVGATENLKTRIRLDRFVPNSTGWKLIRDENGNRVEDADV